MSRDVTELAAIRPKALAALRDGRVTVLHARFESEATRPYEVIARMRSGNPDTPDLVHVVDLLDGTWDCHKCPHPQPCPHVAAVQLITGHESAAARTLPDEKATA